MISEKAYSKLNFSAITGISGSISQQIKRGKQNAILKNLNLHKNNISRIIIEQIASYFTFF